MRSAHVDYPYLDGLRGLAILLVRPGTRLDSPWASPRQHAGRDRSDGILCPVRVSDHEHPSCRAALASYLVVERPFSA
jgi:hypothetical protein